MSATAGPGVGGRAATPGAGARRVKAGLRRATAAAASLGAMILRTPSALRTVLVAAWALFAVAAAQGATNPVAIDVEVYVVSQVTRDDGTREERFTAASEARPGQIVEYRLIVRNVGDETLPAGIVVITGPVPEGTQFVPFSATPSDDGLLTEYSADRGTTFFETNVFVGVGDQRRIAEPTTYDAVRWTFLADFEPGQERVLVYRVTVR